MIHARQMSDNDIDTELRELFAKWDELQKDLDESGGMSGSPGEWMVERMDELEGEKSRRLTMPDIELEIPSAVDD
jgi:hypothetical protein